MLSRREMGSCQQEHSRQERPEHQADRDGEGPVHFRKIQPGQGEDISVLQRLGEQSHDHRRRQDSLGRHLAVRQRPVDEEEDGDAGSDRRDLHDHKVHHLHIPAVIAVQRILQDGYVSGGQSYREQGERSAGKHEPERHQLISQVGAIVAKSPDAVQRNFERQKNSSGGNQQHGQREHLRPMVRSDQRIQVPDHKFLASRKIVAQQILDNTVHHLGTNDVSDQCHQQQQEREEGQNEVGGDGKRKGVHIGPKQIACGGAQDAFGWSGTMLSRALLAGKLNGSDRRHWFLKYYQILTSCRRGAAGAGPARFGTDLATDQACFQPPASNFALSNPNLPAIIWSLLNPTGWRMSSRIDVSVSASDIAPSSSRLHRISSRANPSTECRGAVSVGASLLVHGDAKQNSYRHFEGVFVPGFLYRVSGTPGQTEKETERIILSESKGVSL